MSQPDHGRASVPNANRVHTMLIFKTPTMALPRTLTMPKITFVNEKKEIEIPAGSNLREESRKAGVEVHPWIFKYPGLNCMGNGLCATCRVLVKKGMENLSKKGLIEKISLNTIHAFESIG